MYSGTSMRATLVATELMANIHEYIRDLRLVPEKKFNVWICGKVDWNISDQLYAQSIAEDKKHFSFFFSPLSKENKNRDNFWNVENGSKSHFIEPLCGQKVIICMGKPSVLLP